MLVLLYGNCDCETETEVISRVWTGVLFHCMISVSILFTILEGEEHGKSLSSSILHSSPAAVCTQQILD